MEEKFCKGCNQSKQLTDFAKKGNGLQSKCKACQNALHKKHYQENIEGYKDRAKKNNKKKTLELREYIQKEKDKPCQDCGKTYSYYVMDFDHREGEEKLYNIALMARERLSLETVRKEIAKCDIVCANCHRERTHNRSKTV